MEQILRFKEKLVRAIEKSNSYVCVGLDSDLKKVPEFIRNEKEPLYTFNKAIIEATSEDACAYKINIAFYESAGLSGIKQLEKTMECFPEGKVKIIDAKRGDIGNTSAQYAKAIFDVLKGDAVTVSPYLGYDGIEPFYNYGDAGVIILCLTSNAGSADFQKLKLETGEPLYKNVAHKIKLWEDNNPGQTGIVVGATHPGEIREIRDIVGGIPFLIPGIGAQQGDLEATVAAGIGIEKYPAMINSSRGIIFASRDNDFAEAASTSCRKLKDEINAVVGSL